jgi:NDP-sugar pyrophosphorylase family protein
MKNRLECQSLFAFNNYLFRELFCDLAYPWEILSILKQRIKSIIDKGIEGYTLVRDDVFIGKGARIADSAIIEGPAIIGDGCEVRHCAYIRGSVILGNGCVVGNSCEIKNSVIFDGAQIPHFNYVGDSVLGNGVHLGAGAICSNLRSDKKNVVIKLGENSIETGLKKVGAFLGDGVEIGCNSVLNPGTIVGKNASVYPLSCVRGVVKENSIYKNKNEVVEKING